MRKGRGFLPRAAIRGTKARPYTLRIAPLAP
jgi:hypothetical protein